MSRFFIVTPKHPSELPKASAYLISLRSNYCYPTRPWPISGHFDTKHQLSPVSNHEQLKPFENLALNRSLVTDADTSQESMSSRAQCSVRRFGIHRRKRTSGWIGDLQHFSPKTQSPPCIRRAARVLRDSPPQSGTLVSNR